MDQKERKQVNQKLLETSSSDQLLTQLLLLVFLLLVQLCISALIPVVLIAICRLMTLTLKLMPELQIHFQLPPEEAFWVCHKCLKFSRSQSVKVISPPLPPTLSLFLLCVSLLWGIANLFISSPYFRNVNIIIDVSSFTPINQQAFSFFPFNSSHIYLSFCCKSNIFR